MRIENSRVKEIILTTEGSEEKGEGAKEFLRIPYNEKLYLSVLSKKVTNFHPD